MMKKLSQLIIILIFLAISLFVFTNRVEAACNCYDTTACGARGGHCVPGAQCSGSDQVLLGLCPCSTSAECVCCIKTYPTPTWAGSPYSYPAGSAECRNALGTPPNVCCRTGGCDSECGPLDKWEYCYAAICWVRGGVWQWKDWTILDCPVTDTCEVGTPYLRPGICDSTGCTVGGRYKICCKPDSSTCNCLGGKNTGVCPSSCPAPGPNILTCSTTATHTACSGTSCVTVSGAGTNECSSDSECGGGGQTHRTCSGTSCVTVSGAGSNQCNSNSDCGGATHRVCSGNSCVTVSGAGTNACSSNSDCGGGGTLCTPGACVDSCHRCSSDGRSTGLDYTCSSDWCACARQYNYPPGWEANCGSAPPAPTSCSARGGFCAYNGSCPTNKGYNNLGSTSDCPGGCCACY